MVRYGDMMNTVLAPPGMTGGAVPSPGMTGGFIPQRPGGMNPAPMMPGMPGTAALGPRPPMGGGGGGWLQAMTGVLDGLSGMEKAYLLSSAVGGLGGFLERRQDRKFKERVYEEGREDERRHRTGMAANLNRMGL